MLDKATEDWLSIFNDKLLNIWQKESKPIRNAAMLLCALNEEFERMQFH